MKKTLLSSFLMLSTLSMAQFTQTNEPAIGNTQLMFVCDSAAPSYGAITGTGVTWDYSGYGQRGTLTRNINIKDPSATTEGSNFPGSTKAFEIENYITSYISSTASSRNCKGFTFNEPTYGTVNVKFSTNDEQVMQYPFAVTNTFTDNFSGTVTTSGTPPLTANCSGSGRSSVDGSGTLKLNAATTLSNVLRYKLTDTVNATVPFVGSIKMIRTQFEYYQLSTSTLPKFVHTTLLITIAGAPRTLMLVLNSAQPDGKAALEENALNNLSIYPNPATDVISVNGLTAAAQCTLTDAQGKVISAADITPAQSTISVSGVTPGIYFLHITSEGKTATERVVIR